MINSRIRIALAAGCVSLLVLASAASAQTFGTGTFPNTGSIEEQLRRGVSTKAEVQRLLGVPNGTGGGDMARPAAVAVPALGEGPREIWYYDDIEITDMRSGEGATTFNLRQQILLVFFKGDIFDGYLWTTNVLTPTAK